jgi:hypothetical protein
MWDDLINDLRYAFRQIAKHKVHTAIIVITLAICMGSNTTAYNFVVKLISKPYDYVDDERIVMIGKVWSTRNNVPQLSIPIYPFFEEHCTSFTDIGFIDDVIFFDMDLGGRVRRVSTDKITPTVWSVTGIQPIAGRFFTEEDVDLTQGKVIVLSEKLWLELGGKEDDLLGQNLVLDNQSYRIIGVAPKSFYLSLTRVDAWVPQMFQTFELDPNMRNNYSHEAIAKLKPGVTLGQANQNLKRLHEAFLQLYPEDRDDQERTGASFGAIKVNGNYSGGLEGRI